MLTAKLHDVVQFCDRILQPGAFRDYDGAVNGLQVQNTGTIRRIAAAVDASLTTVRMAADQGANLMIVHHGLFWGPSHPWTGRKYELIRQLVGADMAIYSMHLPLDGHRRLGNAVQLARALGFTRTKPFFIEHGVALGCQFKADIPRAEIAARLLAALGAAPKCLPGGGPMCGRVGICTGGAGAQLARAASEGVDTFITGEGPHWTYALAEDHGINVFYGGHYATETFGVKALAASLSRKFSIPWTFVDHPTGL